MITTLFWSGFLFFVAAMIIGRIRNLHSVEGSDLRVNEWHHAYLGMVLFWMGFRLTGAVLMFDDGIQHIVQAVTKNTKFRGPLTRIYELIYKIGIIQKINKWLDDRFNKLP